MTEASILAETGFTPELGGIHGDMMAVALSKLGVGEHVYFSAGIVEDWPLLFERVPFIALLTRHWVIVERVGPRRVTLADPGLPNQPTGCRVTIDRAEFEQRWARGAYQVVFRPPSRAKRKR